MIENKLARNLQDADSMRVADKYYEITGQDCEQMEEGAEDVCLYVEESEYHENTSFHYDEIAKAQEAGDLTLYMLTPFEQIRPTYQQLLVACKANYPECEVISFMEALERWSVLNKNDLKRMDDCLKLRVLGHREDAKDIITLATKAEFKNAKKAEVGVQLMHAMQSGGPVVFYELGDCKGGRYGLEGHEYASFYI